MRKSILITVIALFCAGVGEAHAQGFRGWLDKLSGPGGFEGWGAELPFLCYGFDKLNPDARNRTFFPDWNCSRADRRDRRPLVIGLEVAFYTTARNRLEYEGNPTPDERVVKWRSVVPTAEFLLGPNGAIEAGAGAGVSIFDGRLFETKTRFTIQAIRFTVKPFRLLSPSGWASVLQGRFVLTTIPGGFDAADFGATGSWAAGTEAIAGGMIVIDLGEVVFRR